MASEQFLEFLEKKMSERFWIPDEKLVFIPAWLIDSRSGLMYFKTDEGREASFPLAIGSTFNSCSDQQLLGVDNVVTMDSVSSGALLHTVRTRYARKQIYTSVAHIIIAVNPFEHLPIYSSKHVDMYSEATDSLELPPHVYSVGSDAFRGLMDYGTNQAILVSGESGAGKTESTKLVLSYLADVAGNDGNTISGIEEQILQADPVLEGFGNAMTTRNNNSSRFGKWIEVAFTTQMEIVGSRITDYLLEVTRVCFQSPSEGNYHVFYQLLASESRGAYHLTRSQDYHFLSRRIRAPEEINADSSNFKALELALDKLGFSSAKQNEMWRVIAAILHLGNAQFEPLDITGTNTTGSQLVSADPVKKAAELLDVGFELLEKCMTHRRLYVGKDVAEKPLPPYNATSSRDALAKLMYGKIFKWIITKINLLLETKQMSATDVEQNERMSGTDFKWIGLLDIAGFETFTMNSIEQLFINLSNEELQQHFNNHVFKSELADYEEEGVPMATINFADNTDCLQLIARKDGLLDLLDEEVNIPQATDATYAQKACRKFHAHSCFIQPKFSGKNVFTIKHFADKVEYTCDGWLEKNLDQIPPASMELLKASSLGLLRDIVVMIAEGQSAAPSRKKKTVASAYKASLQMLISKVSEATPHFIRCIKPNHDKMPSKFVSALAFEQLAFSGVIEAVKIRQAGYPLRMTFKEFFRRYGMGIPRQVISNVMQKQRNLHTAEAMKEIVKMLPDLLGAGVTNDEFAVGKNKIFIRQQAQKGLEQYRRLAFSGASMIIQRVWKGYAVRRRVKVSKELFRKIRSWLDENCLYGKDQNSALAKVGSGQKLEEMAKELQNLIVKATDAVPQPPNVEVARTVYLRMMKEVELVKRMELLTTSMDVVEIERILAQATDLCVVGAIVPKLKERCNKLKVQLPLLKALECADLTKENLAEFTRILDAIKVAGLDAHPEEWITPDGAVYSSGMQRRVEELKKMIDAEKKKAEEAKQRAQKAERMVKEARTPEERVKAERLAQEAAEKSKNAQEKLQNYNVPEKGAPKEKRRDTITGMKVQDQEMLVEQLKVASLEYDVVQLELLLREAVQNGIPQTELREHEELFHHLQQEQYVLRCMEETSYKVSAEMPSATTLKQLGNLARQGGKLGLPPLLTQNTILAMQRGVRMRARSEFHKADTLELDLQVDAFNDLSKFPLLQDARKWQGTKGTGFSRIFGYNKDNMLVHSTERILGPLTKVPSNLKSLAVQNFRNVLGWMGDRIVQECRRTGLGVDIVTLAKSHAELRDEIYVQVMKQLTDNPSLRAELLGWKLLLMLCQQIAPSAHLLEFVRAFLRKAITQRDNSEIAQLANQCVSDLNTTTAHENRPSWQNNGDSEESRFKVHVELMDQTARQTFVSKTTTLRELTGIMSEMVGICSTAADFSFFQVTEGLDAHRLLPDQAVISQLFMKWEKLYEATKRSSRLVWKRRFLRGDESLRAGDVAHAALSYRQAAWEFLRCPVWEEPEILAHVAGTILSLEKRHYAKEIRDGKLYEGGAIEQLIPGVAVNHPEGVSRKKWSNLVLNTYKKHYQMFENESQIQKMHRSFSCMQKTRFFGAYYWLGKQVFNVPQEKRSMNDVPAQLLKLNPRQPQGDYWICVDRHGIRFVSCDSGPGREFQRGFLFAEDAMDRMLRWGAKQDMLQLVVQTVSPLEPAKGRMPMTVGLMCPAAIDVAYAIHRISTENLD
eukprot:GEMP01000398.1.p1 GENE.GEMP01000398.1~~GEMP01000398.1.p1  ORF type:complete len:1716 (+),score=392.76 GEMP01000398.1:66-5213(+)